MLKIAGEWMNGPAVQRVLDALPSGAVRFVGGCVRDTLAGRPVTDVDLATTLQPDKVMTLLADAGIRAIPTGIDHGTVTAVASRQRIEITTLRRDVDTDGRRATIAFTDDWRQDAARRDLTINALYCDRHGEVFDPFDGAADLKAGRVRFVGDPATRIKEDYLRLLRFFRFYAGYGTPPLDAPARAACKALVHGLDRLAGERIRTEILRTLPQARAVEAVGDMIADGILAHIAPGLDDHAGFARGHAVVTGPGAEAARALAEEVGATAPSVVLLALLTSAGAAHIAERLRLSRAEHDLYLAAIAGRDGCHPGIAPEADKAARQAALLDLGRGGALAQCLVARSASDGDLADGWARLADDLAALPIPAFPLAGRDVLALGAAPGPAVGDVLRQVIAWWRGEGFRPGREACLAELRRVVENTRTTD